MLSRHCQSFSIMITPSFWSKGLPSVVTSRKFHFHFVKVTPGMNFMNRRGDLYETIVRVVHTVFRFAPFGPGEPMSISYNMVVSYLLTDTQRILPTTNQPQNCQIEIKNTIVR